MEFVLRKIFGLIPVVILSRPRQNLILRKFSPKSWFFLVWGKIWYLEKFHQSQSWFFLYQGKIRYLENFYKIVILSILGQNPTLRKISSIPVVILSIPGQNPILRKFSPKSWFFLVWGNIRHLEKFHKIVILSIPGQNPILRKISSIPVVILSIPGQNLILRKFSPKSWFFLVWGKIRHLEKFHKIVILSKPSVAVS